MRKNTKNFPARHIPRLLFIFFLFLGSGLSATNNPTVTISFSGCTATIKTTIEGTGNSDPVGLFYRLVHSSGTYFWRSDIKTPNSTGTTDISKSISNLPDGFYKVICYELRKNGPVRTGSGSKSLSGGCTSGNTLPEVDFSASNVSFLMLSPSWNVFTNSGFDFTGCDYLADNLSVMAPRNINHSWLFIMLSVQDWIAHSNLISVRFDDVNLDFVGAIEQNAYTNEAGIPTPTWAFVDNPITLVTNTGQPSTIQINRTTSTAKPGNRQTHVYLIFENSQSITAENLEFSALIEGNAAPDTITSISLPVKGNPHDPNSLEVHRKKLCRCQKAEKLYYRMNFQNKGTAEAAEVVINLSDDPNLDYNTLQIIPSTVYGPKKTTLRGATINHTPGSKTFKINMNPNKLWLPGSAQKNPRGYAYTETEDYFRFSIQTKPCRKNNTLIKPKATILFYGGTTDSSGSVTVDTISQTPIDTNFETTEMVEDLVSGDSIEQCPPPDSSCTGCDKKPCWLISWLFPNKKK